MKKAGFLVFAFGLMITIFTGMSYVTKEDVTDAGNVSVTSDEGNASPWLPLIGVGVMIIGGAIFVAGVSRDRPRSKA